MTLGRRTSEGEGENEAKWLAGDPKRKWGSLPLNGSKYKKSEFLGNARGRRTIAILLRAKDKKTETRGTPKSFKPALKTVQSLLARERREILQWNPVKKKNKISNFGTFFRYTQILLPLSLSIWKKRIKAKKRHLYSWTILLYVFDTLNVYIYIYNRSKELMYFHFYHVVYVIIPCFPFSFYSPYIILLRTVLLIPKASHGKPELPTVAILILLQLRPIGPYSSII